jgi:hypothetical protein
VRGADVDLLLDDAAVDELVYVNTNRGLGNVEHNSSSAVVVLEGHALVNRRVDFDINIVSSLNNKSHQSIFKTQTKIDKIEYSHRWLRRDTQQHSLPPHQSPLTLASSALALTSISTLLVLVLYYHEKINYSTNLEGTKKGGGGASSLCLECLLEQSSSGRAITKAVRHGAVLLIKSYK